MSRKRQESPPERDRPLPERDPCDCDDTCPSCDRKCLGGHANYPGHHLCADLHQWGARR